MIPLHIHIFGVDVKYMNMVDAATTICVALAPRPEFATRATIVPIGLK
jgi:hypothetical protein